jgi:threonine dehydrogenase-like Zn-dependent dehydrogenase
MGEIDIQGGYIEHGEIPAALDYIAQKQVRVEPLISREIRLDEVVMYGFKELLKPDTEAIKILVSFEGGTP